MDFNVEDTTCRTAKTQKFDAIIGHIEDIIISDRFRGIQDSFMEKYYKEFDDSEENKLVYMDIFKEYTATIEKCLNDELVKRVPDFSMETFVSTLQAHKDEIVGDIFDMLLSFTDFIAFKDMFLDYKAEKEGKNMDLNNGFTVRQLPTASGSSGEDRGDGNNTLPMSTG